MITAIDKAKEKLAKDGIDPRYATVAQACEAIENDFPYASHDEWMQFSVDWMKQRRSALVDAMTTLS